MNPPPLTDVFAAIEATWAPHTRTPLGPWMLRDGAGGGKRVSAASAEGDVAPSDIAALEAAGETLIMVRPWQTALDADLAARGWARIDPTRILAAKVEDLAMADRPRLSGLPHWPPLAIAREIWTEGGVGPARQAVMARVQGPKTAILARGSDRAAGAAFVAVHKDIALVHAVEVVPSLRRRKVAAHMMGAAAAWAQDVQVPWLFALVTEANSGARKLYDSLGLRDVGHYHYRIKAT